MPTIVASSMLTSVGRNTISSCAAMRSGIARFEEIDYYDDRRSPIIASPIPGLPWTRDVRGRLLPMLDIVLTDLTERQVLAHATRVPLLLALGERFLAGAEDKLAQDIVAHAAAHLGPRYDESRSLLNCAGGPAGFRVLERARRLIASGDAELCLVCAVDSWLDAQSLSWLSHRVPIRTLDSDGVSPGEACVALVVANDDWISSDQGQARFLSIGSAIEPAVIDPDMPFRADGMTKAVTEALSEAGLNLHDIRLRMSDSVGDYTSAKEQMLVLARLLRIRMDNFPLWLPAECIGHVGAAAGLVQVVWGIQASARRYLRGSPILCTTGNFDGERAALVVDVPLRGGAWS